jgi:phage/plasmid-like protein (TIGR03299 family)
MAHLVENMAYTGTTPWHGLGNKINPDSSLEEWKEAAGLNWEVIETPATFQMNDQHLAIPNKKVLVRSDNNFPLSVVSDKYKTVQPDQVMEFFRDLVDQHNFEIDTAGVLKEGRRVWALAKTGSDFTLKGNDKVESYLLLGTSFDNSLATVAKFTSVRVVCNNTLGFATNSQGVNDIRVYHHQDFNADKVKFDMGFHELAWNKFHQNAEAMTGIMMDQDMIDSFLVNTLGNSELGRNEEGQRNLKVMDNVEQLFKVSSIGNELESSQNTLWGMVNAVTEYTDHHRGNSAASRMNQAWFGTSNRIKTNAWENALQLVA